MRKKITHVEDRYQPFAIETAEQNRANLFDKIVTGRPNAYVADMQLVEQGGHGVVDVLGAVVGVEADDDEREQVEQGFEQGYEKTLGDRRHSADVLVLCDLVDDIDQVHALGAVAIALMDGVDAQEARPAIGPWGSPNAHRGRGRLRPNDHRALRPVGSGAAQIVNVARRDPRQALEARVAEEMALAVQYRPCRQTGHLAKIRIHPGQQPDVGRRVDPYERPALVAGAAVEDLRRLAVLAEQSRELSTRKARRLGQVALYQCL